jgi:predicted nucleic acid-binding protein
VPTYLLDASALCKRYFVNEVGANLVNDLFQEPSSPRYILNLAILEALNAFYRVHRESYLTEEERDAFVAALYNDITTGRLLVYSVRDEHIFNCEPIPQVLQAMKVTKKRPGPVDALVVACARELDPADRTLVSSDVDLNTLAQQFGVPVLDPEQPTP